ncbi:hypothetical protein [Piscinibacter sp.]|uniref:hypothetical protein n=1 Tax=Piscinibacter sp. TaxID=1903157 RepID=UPI0039E35DB7
MTSGKKPSVRPGTERRSGRDRRQADQGPPAGRDRRVSVEPRKPEISEVEITPSEWRALEEELLSRRKPPPG